MRACAPPDLCAHHRDAPARNCLTRLCVSLCMRHATLLRFASTARARPPVLHHCTLAAATCHANQSPSPRPSPVHAACVAWRLSACLSSSTRQPTPTGNGAAPDANERPEKGAHQIRGCLVCVERTLARVCRSVRSTRRKNRRRE